MASEGVRSPHRGHKGAALRVVIFGLTLLIVIMIAAAWWLRASVNERVNHNAADRVITIPPGLGTRAIVNRLSEAGIVRRPAALTLYLTITGRAGQLKAGDYKFTSPISPLQAIEKMRRGEVYFERVTIPEGFNRFEIAEALAAKTGKATAQEFLRIMNDTAPIARIAPAAGNLEGYLFPDTYNYTTQTTAEELVAAMVKRFDEVFSPELATRASQLGMSVHEVVTLASIIEKEARVDEDRPLIASVLVNRLRQGMRLAADPTFIYAAILARDYDGNPNQPRHRHRDSRYNTYVYPGLPPGPIASPGRESLRAALFPASTDYLYFVRAGADGRHKFSRTAAEHNLAAEQYHRQRQQQQQNRGAER